MSEHTAEAVNVAAEAYTEARQVIAEVLNDPEAKPGSLSAAAHEAEAARAGYEQAVHVYQAEAEAGA